MKNVDDGDYARVARAIEFLDRNALRQPRLDDVAAHLHLSAYHFQRLFKRWAGVSPKRFVQIVTLQAAKSRLRGRQSVLDTTYDAGLSSPGRLHDLFVELDAVTPGEFKAFGRGLRIAYGFHPTPFGEALLGATERGICHLQFVASRARALSVLKKSWPAARLEEDAAWTGELARRAFQVETAATGATGATSPPLRLICRGTNFQASVWRALLKTRSGTTTTYQAIANDVCYARSARAVGQAVGSNPIAFLIPCHRVLKSSGALSGYRWGVERKAAMLCWEAARAAIRSK
jgi:AraC family transcriptional regulator, regulatory protein of adaptative response / methylated-DNA-[protein]-cysteine methyltransferase